MTSYNVAHSLRSRTILAPLPNSSVAGPSPPHVVPELIPAAVAGPPPVPDPLPEPEYPPLANLLHGAMASNLSRPSIDSLSNGAIVDSCLGVALPPADDVTPPDYNQTGRLNSSEDNLAVVNETFVPRPERMFNSTPMPTGLNQRWSELRSLALSLAKITDEAEEISNQQFPVAAIERDAVRNKLLRCLPTFQYRLQFCYNQGDQDPQSMVHLQNLGRNAETALAKLGVQTAKDCGRSTDHLDTAAPVDDGVSESGSRTSTASSSASEAKIKLLLERAKVDAAREGAERTRNLALEKHKLEMKQAKREFELKLLKLEEQREIEVIGEKEQELKLQLEKRAQELAIADLEAMERGLPVGGAVASVAQSDSRNYNNRATRAAVQLNSRNYQSTANILPATPFVSEVISAAPSVSHVRFAESADEVGRAEKQAAGGSSFGIGNAAGARLAVPICNPALATVATTTCITQVQPTPVQTPPLSTPTLSTSAPSFIPEYLAGPCYSCANTAQGIGAAAHMDTNLPGPSKSFSSFQPPQTKTEKTTSVTGMNGYPFQSCDPSTAQPNNLQKSVSRPNESAPIVLEVGAAFSALLKQSRLPQGEPPVFDGSKLDEYLPFISAFETLIADNCYDDEQRYRLLLKYTAKDALDLVQSCHRPNISEAYTTAMHQLKGRYGNRYKLAQYHINQLYNWPTVRAGNTEDMMRLSLYLERIANMMYRGVEWLQLDNPRELSAFAEKLPFNIRRAWAECICTKQRQQLSAGFADLVNIVKREAEVLACPGVADLLKSKPSQSPSTRCPRTSVSKAFTLRTEQIKTDSPTENQFTKSLDLNRAREKQPGSAAKPMQGRACAFCSRRGHSLSQCEKFGNSTWNDRRDWIKNHRICFKCLEAGHWANHCVVKLWCSICNSDKHGTAMHIRQELPLTGANTIALSSRSANRQSNFSPLVSVEVLAPNGNVHRTYAALDTWASSSFISNSLVSTLQVNGKLTPLKVSTINVCDMTLQSRVISGLQIRGLNCSRYDSLSELYQVENWPLSRSDIPPVSAWSAFPHLVDIPVRHLDSAEVGLLIGQSDSELLKVLETVSGLSGDPYATRHSLGWALQGSYSENSSDEVHHCCLQASAAEQLEMPTRGSDHDMLCLDLEAMYRAEFNDPNPGLKGNSQEDHLWEQKVRDSMCMRNSKLQIDLPFRSLDPSMPNNVSQAFNCALQLKQRLMRDPVLREDYVKFMEKMVANGHLEMVPKAELSGVPGKIWYLIHHPVRHKIKGKLRVVFDCSRKYQGISLNGMLLQGPDLLNKLVGVLLRFRAHPIAFCGDIEQMFLQLKVPCGHADFMRLFWWENGDLSGEALQYRLTCHTFGAVSSPSIANYAVKQAALKAETFSSSARDALAEGAYMDDILCSAPSIKEAKEIIAVVRQAADSVGFNLRGIVSNSPDVLSSIPAHALAANYVNLDASSVEIPRERVLGVSWLVNEDSLSFNLAPPMVSSPTTKRMFLSSVSSVFDPLGLAIPVIIPIRALFQQTCIRNIGWDDALPGDIEQQWRRWLCEVPLLENLRIPRCFDSNQTLEKKTQIHIFADGSEVAYAAVAYSRCIAYSGTIETCLLMAKSRQVPVSKGAFTTIPRIELGAAKLAVSLAMQVMRELTINPQDVYYWSDSLTVLHYLRNTTGRFQRFVANKVDFILQYSHPDNWLFVPGRLNIADVASRGCTVPNLIANREWVAGPAFLRKGELPKFEEPKDPKINLETKERVLTVSVDRPNGAADQLLDSSSSWLTTIKRVYVFLAFSKFLRSKKPVSYPPSGSSFQEAELTTWKYVQARCFGPQIKSLKRKEALTKRDSLARLSPKIEDGLVTLDSRVLHDSVQPNSVSPIILTCDDHVVRIYIRYIHELYKHAGKAHLMALLQERFHILGLGKHLKKMLSSCRVCVRLNGRPVNPIMAPLPTARTHSAPRPFFSTGIDYFGPIFVSRGRKSTKVYGVLFTCLTSRAVHLELAESLETASFIAALRRFQARRGTPKIIYSDQGTNLVGAWRVIKKEIQLMNRNLVLDHAAQHKIYWTFSPPKGSHFGGAWERLIRSTRRILLATACETKRMLSYEELLTLFCEAEFILNSRPLTPVSAESTATGPITPNHLLLGTDSPAYAISGVDSNLCYVRERWKFVQSLADKFWKRWRKEYLPTLRVRPKWLKSRKNLEVGDMVLVIDGDAPRGSWPTAIIESVHPSRDQVVRRVSLRMARTASAPKFKLPGVTVLERPVHKLVLVYKWNQLQDTAQK